MLSTSPRQRALAKAEARDLGRSLRRWGIPQREIACTVPQIARGLTELEWLETTFLRVLRLPMFVVMTAIYYLVYVAELSYLGVGKLFGIEDLPSRLSALNIYQGLFLCGGSILFPVYQFTGRRNVRRKRMLRYQQTRRRQIVATTLRVGLFILIECLGLTIVISQIVLGDVAWRDFWLIATGVVVSLMWALLIVYIVYIIYTDIGPSALRPELEIIRSLFDAILSGSTTKPSSGRNFRIRRTVAVNILSATKLLEKQMVRLLARNDKEARRIVWPTLGGAAAALRQQLALLTMPSANAMSELNKSLCIALVCFAAGDLSKLEKLQVDVPIVTRSEYNLFDALRWLAFAIGPALVVSILIYVGWIKEDPLRSLSVQFAVLCFIYTTYSAFGQAGRDELSGVISSGTSLFGWGKKE